MKYLFPFWATLGLLLLAATSSQADCNNPRIIRSAQNGDFNTASTWTGGVVPTICDYVVVDHAVTLNVGFTTGQNGNGSVVVNNGGTLSGPQTLTVNNGYSLTNNGTLSINNVQLNSGGATFVNNGTATLGQSQSWDTGSQVINAGVLTVSGGISQNSGRFSNVARFGRLQVSGQVRLQGASTWDNVGRIVSTSTNTTQALYLEGGNSLFYNRPTGRLVMNGGGVYLTNSTFFYNENYASVLNFETHDDQQGRVYNTDTLLVRGNLINGSPNFNYAGAYIKVDGNFSQISKTNAIMYTDGYVNIAGNFSNDKRIGGGTGGGFYVAGSSVNTANGQVEGSVDFCDPSVGGNNANGRPNIFDSNNNNNQGSNYGVAIGVTRCGYVAQTATLKPDLISGPAQVCAGSQNNVYSIASVSGATDYVWSVPAGSSIVSGQGTTSITVTAGSTAGVVSVRVSGSGPDYAATSKLLLLSGNTPAQPNTIVGPNTTLCPAGQGYAFTVAPVSGATEYTWTVPAGWVINYGQGTSSITLTSGATTGDVTVTAKNACGTSAARALAVTPPAALSATSFTGTPNTSFCTNQNPSYNVASVTGATGYKWMVSAGATINTNNAISPGVYGPSNRQISFPSVGTYTITVIPVNACGDGPSTTLTVTVGQSLGSAPSFTATNTATRTNITQPCAGNAGYVYEATAVTYAVAYEWQIPNGWTVTSPYTLTNGRYRTTTPTITVTAGSTANSGQVLVRAVGPCNTSGDAGLNNFAQITPQASPAAPTFTLNPATYCPNADNTYRATMPNGSVTPTWTVPTGWTMAVSTSGTVTTLTATPGPNATDGNVTLYVTNNGGCQSPALTQAVTSNATTPTFAATTATTNPGAVTTGQSYTYQVASTGADAYNWTVPAGWSITAPTGATNAGTQLTTTSPSITVTAGTGTGSVTVSGTKNGCTGAPASRPVQANQPTNYAAINYGPAKKLTCYTTGQNLLTAADADGTIVSATVVSGSLPAGVSLNPNTGELTVSDASLMTARLVAGPTAQPAGGPATALVSSTTSFTVRTVDNLGGQTDTPISLTFNSDAAPSVSVAQPKVLQQYANGDVLATYADPDGAITSATLDSGFLPAGTTLVTDAASGTGRLVVSNASQLTPGTYTFATRCTDGSCLIGVGVVSTTVSIGNSQTLPVELTAFAAARHGRGVLLTWTTAQERDNAYFQVERSPDGREFTALGRVAGQGTSTSVHSYAYPDAAPLAGLSYYRLRQVDRDGAEHLSAVRTVAAVAEAGARLAATAYPNPTPGRLTLVCSGAAPKSLQVVVSTPVGKVLRTLELPLNGAAEASLDLSALPAGVYLLRLQAEARQTVLRVTKE